MAKLSIKANPTFKAKVPIPMAGAPPVPVEMVFRHRTKTQLGEWLKTVAGRPDLDAFMEMVEGWELEDPFNKENAGILLENYGGAAMAVFETYSGELAGARTKN